MESPPLSTSMLSGNTFRIVVCHGTIRPDIIRDHPSGPTRALAGAVHAFLTATVSQRRPDLDISQRKLIGIGHSIGAPALLVRQVADLGHSHGCPFRFLTRDLTPRVTFESIIAIEPGISMKDLPEARMSSQMLTAWTWLRKDVWSSRAAAKRELSSSPVYNTWDPRVLDLFIVHTDPLPARAPLLTRGVRNMASGATPQRSILLLSLSMGSLPP